MSIALEPKLELALKQRAQAKGFANPNDYLAQLLERDTHQGPSQDRGEDWAWQAIDRVSGSATGGLGTDEIMEMTRGDS